MATMSNTLGGGVATATSTPASMNGALLDLPREKTMEILTRYTQYKKVSDAKRAEQLLEFLMYVYEQAGETLTSCFINKETIDSPMSRFILLQAVKRQVAKRGGG